VNRTRSGTGQSQTTSAGAGRVGCEACPSHATHVLERHLGNKRELREPVHGQHGRAHEGCPAPSRLFLRISQGGMGLYECARNARAAFLGSAALTCETVRGLGINAAMPEAEHLPYVVEHKRAIEWLQQRLPDCAEIRNWTLASILEAPRAEEAALHRDGA